MSDMILFAAFPYVAVVLPIEVVLGSGVTLRVADASVITEVDVRLHPTPSHRITAVAGFAEDLAFFGDRATVDGSS